MAAPRALTWCGRKRAMVNRAPSIAKSALGRRGARAPQLVPAACKRQPARSPGRRPMAARAAPCWCARKCATPKRAPVGTLARGANALLCVAVARSHARWRARMATVKTASRQKTRATSHPLCRTATFNPALSLAKSAPGRRGARALPRAVVARKRKPALSPGLPPMAAPRAPLFGRRNHATRKRARSIAWSAVGLNGRLARSNAAAA